MRKTLMFLVAVCVGASACGGTKPVDEFGMKDQAQIRERAQTTLVQDTRGSFTYNRKNADDLTRSVPQRTMRIREVRFF